MQNSTSLSKETIADVQQQASALIWMLSKRPQSDLWQLEKGEPLVFKTSHDIDEMTRQFHTQQLLFNIIEWLSGIVCDDWWFSGPKALEEIVMEIDHAPVIPVVNNVHGRSSPSLSAWTRFCDVVCDAAKTDRCYGRTSLDIEINALDYDQYKQIGRYHGLVYAKQQSLFNRSECLVPAQTHYDK